MANFSKSPLDLEWRPHREMMGRFLKESISKLIEELTEPILNRKVDFNKWELWMLIHKRKLVPPSSSERLRVAESILKELE